MNSNRKCWLFCRKQCIVYCSYPQISLFNNFFIKNGSHNTIYTFKNYFATVISAINFQFQQNKSYPNRPEDRWESKMKGREKKERKKKNKKTIYTRIVIMHIRIITVVILYICIFLQVLMWVFFGLKCVKLNTFLYFANFCNRWCGCSYDKYTRLAQKKKKKSTQEASIDSIIYIVGT